MHVRDVKHTIGSALVSEQSDRLERHSVACCLLIVVC